MLQNEVTRVLASTAVPVDFTNSTYDWSFLDHKQLFKQSIIHWSRSINCNDSRVNNNNDVSVYLCLANKSVVFLCCVVSNLFFSFVLTPMGLDCWPCTSYWNTVLVIMIKWWWCFCFWNDDDDTDDKDHHQIKYQLIIVALLHHRSNITSTCTSTEPIASLSFSLIIFPKVQPHIFASNIFPTTPYVLN